MPELPEVETVMRGLAPTLTGARIAAVDQNRANLRFPFPERFAERLTGRTVQRLDRRAKYLLASLDDDSVLAMHLGMTGSFRIERDTAVATPGGYYHARAAAGVHDHVILHLGDGTRVTYNDPRRFGFMTLIASGELPNHPLFRAIGLEPLSEEFGGAALARLMKGKATPLKAALLDQTLIAGLGNIYVCEALHRAGLSPRRAAGSIVRADGRPTQRAERLATAIREVLEEAVAAGGSTLRDYRRPDQTLGTFQHTFRAYDREGAPCGTAGCGGLIGRIVQGGRSTFFCGACQH
ncbi:bifunctional DNA-formamidopyrimidine glycosylase/DNA-(apurinic or apyrimidinic site) lyase [Lichenifustis flavocetrariae]|uniref:Formamidopyrimidine-DNA glycosylase n=1 Tax=Lichenifustis flavocetrariae TaxID=2949735 RepID=A0AA41YUJ3_9HYPH|nr:bifunctional DNA-formamidopyrimidine glycosylase/DNA-(apurinic or apyrimidinic site) lyase [Lichenifustis flavocetrariae]MCW6508394.1 bifunctional DNA-formamidopyrimidine glycosylase/DNA-(apurinic or apyrimidinic site) lyase [Lichenifustis flavocetrariae]